MSIRYNSSLVILWNRIAPDTVPSCASSTADVTPRVGPGSVSEQGTRPLERGVEKMMEEILRGLPVGLMPLGWYYRVFISDVGMR